MKVKAILVLLIALNLISDLYSQVTIGSIEKKENVDEKIVLKPEAYDSTKNITYQDNPINYYKYIGLKLYLPPFSDPEIGNYNVEAYCKFLFSPKPVSTKLNDPFKKDRGGFFNRCSDDDHLKFKNISTYVYKPFQYYSGNLNGDCIVEISSKAMEVSDKYYTIINVYSDNERSRLCEKIIDDELAQNKDTSLSVSGIPIIKVYNLNWSIRKIRDTKVLFLLRNDSNGDSVYCINPFHFILVPYFLKKKELYQNKNVVHAGSKWLCIDVTLDKNNNYILSYILKNDNNEQLILDNDLDFITEVEYIKKQRDEKIQNEKRIAQQKEWEAQKQKEVNIRLDKQRQEKENHLTDCVNKYGQHFGSLVAEDKVTIGMTKEMCKEAWGSPYDTYKIINDSGIEETWFYSWKHTLYFENGILKIITE